MDKFNFSDGHELIKYAVLQTIDKLSGAIKSNGEAVWVLAGGTSPLESYRLIVDEYSDALDWSRVAAIIGDERMVDFDSSDSNIGTIWRIFQQNQKTSKMKFIIPKLDILVNESAKDYARRIRKFDEITVMWVGIGEDAHTLSIFPGDETAFLDKNLVADIYNAPKKPPTRITVTAEFMKKVENLFIFASGETKQNALETSFADKNTPVYRVAKIVYENQRNVSWLI